MNKYINCTDADLIELFWKGEEQAFTELTKRHYVNIVRLLAYKIKDSDEAKNIAQDIFIKILTVLRERRYRNENKFKSWLMRITENMVVDFFRNKKKMKTHSMSSFIKEGNDEVLVSSIIPHVESHEEWLINKEACVDIEDLIDKLPEEQKDVVRLRLFNGFQFWEIAEFTDCSINTCLGRMRYALINLRKMIEDRHNSSAA